MARSGWFWDEDCMWTVIAKAELEGDHWALTSEEGWIWGGTPKAVMDAAGVTPQAGDRARFWPRKFGMPVRGLVLNETLIFYRSPKEEEERHRQWVQEKEENDRATFERNRARLDEQFNALPPEFQRRIARFRSNQPKFRWRFESYEMSCCVDAVKIASTLRTREAVRNFSKMSYEEQKTAVPGLFDGHSGNTFGMAVRLAHHYVTEPSLVWREHAAIAALVGCDDAGCPPVDEAGNLIVSEDQDS